MKVARAAIKYTAHLPGVVGVKVALVHAQRDHCKRLGAHRQLSVAMNVQPLRVATLAVDLKTAVQWFFC
ncbi:MAG: hypothetical protein EBR49_12135 [Betaproteobacteria bacterium]|nr:hypothetical protein [Betaproteobacteria bacterium]